MSRSATLPPREDGFVRKKWSIKECRFLVDAGLLEPGKCELIEGEVVFKMGQWRRHVYVISRIVEILSAIFGGIHIQSQAQVGIGEVDEFNDPEPDVAVTRGSLHDYIDREPDPATEVLLVVEASDTTLMGDTTTKVRLYAQNGIPEYWVVSVSRRELIVYRQPSGEEYLDVRTYSETESVCPLAAANSAVRVSDL